MNQDPLEKRLILGPGQEIDKVSLVHLVALKNTEVLPKKKKKKKMESQEPTEGAPSGQNWNNLSSKIK